MSDLTNIVKKEMRELLTPGSVMSVVVMVVLFAGLGSLVGGEVEKASALPVFGFANADEGVIVFEDGSEWNAYEIVRDVYRYNNIPDEVLDEYIVPVEISGPDSIYDRMSESGVTAMIAIDEDFADNVLHNLSATGPDQLRSAVIWEYYIFEPTGMFGTMSSSMVNMIIGALNDSLSEKLISGNLEPGQDYGFMSNPVTHGSGYMNTIIDGQAHPGVTPQEISSQISSQTMMIPIIIMIIIMMVGSIVISSMGSEKENKTLETLLTLPIRRTTIVTGKIIAAAVVGLIYGLAYMVGMKFYMDALMSPANMGVDLAELGMTLDAADWAMITVSMFLAIVCALGICMILGAFAKNYKSAQTMTMPLSILAMIPMFIIMFSGWYGSGPVLQAVAFAIPFSHPMMAMQSLMYGDVGLVAAGILYQLLFAVVSVAITVRLYNSDILVTGLGQNRFVQKLTKNQ